MPEDYRRGDGTLATVATCIDIAALGDAFRAHCEKRWHWVDVIAGKPVTVNAGGPDDTASLAAMLQPFRT